ncbi:MAG: DUF2007 domain-containing protein [Bacteroidota bacterium]
MSDNQERLVSIYTTTNPAMIAVVKSILDNAEIDYMVQGEPLQGVWGQFQWVDFLVNSDQETEAREVLREVSETKPDSPLS